MNKINNATNEKYILIKVNFKTIIVLFFQMLKLSCNYT